MPKDGEYARAFERYVARVRHVADPLAELSAQRARVLTRLSPLTEEQLLLRIARGDTTPLSGFEEGDYARAAGAHQRPYGDLLAEWSVIRDATSALAASLSARDWANQGTSSDAPTTARALLYIILGHTEHHLAVLSDRYGVR